MFAVRAKRVHQVKRDQLIDIQTPTHVSDGLGGIASTSWATHQQAWVNIRPVQAREEERFGALRASCIYLIAGLYDELKDITGEMRVSWDNEPGSDLTILNIREIRKPASRELFMEFTAESGVET